jgi:hypothetical protein
LDIAGINIDKKDKMLKELRNDLISFISSIPGVNRCTKYRGELEEGSEWNPVFPSSFVNFTAVTPLSHSADSRMIGRNRFAAEIYVADRHDCADLTETITNELDATEITLGENIYQVKLIEISLLGYVRSVEIWKLKIELH